MANQVSRTITWLEERIKVAHQDAEAHPPGPNRTFYMAQAIAYENALSALQNDGRLVDPESSALTTSEA